MILRKHLPLKAKYFAILGLISLPTISLAHVQAEHAKQHHKPVVSHTHPKVGGVGSFNYSFDDTGYNKVSNSKKYGDWRFHTFQLELTGDVKGLDYKVDYAWFRSRLLNMISVNDPSTYNHFLETYVSHKFSNDVVGQIGNTKVPFGNMDTFSFWHNIPFYAGLGENYQTGLKMIYSESPWNVQVQLGKNSLVNPNNASSYTPKLTTGYYNASSSLVSNSSATNSASTNYAQNNEDSLQLVARVTHVHHFNDHDKVEVGLSGRTGQIYNKISNARGKQFAGAVHVNGYFDRWIVQLQYTPYRYSPEYRGGTDSAVTGADIINDTIQLGKDGVLYAIPDKANIFAAGLGYKVPVSWGKVDEVTIYDDYSMLSGKNTKKNTRLNIVGFKFNAGPLFITAEAISGKNMVGIGQDTLPNLVPNVYNIGGNGRSVYSTVAGVLTETAVNDNVDHWKTKFNINIAIKF